MAPRGPAWALTAAAGAATAGGPCLSTASNRPSPHSQHPLSQSAGGEARRRDVHRLHRHALPPPRPVLHPLLQQHLQGAGGGLGGPGGRRRWPLRGAAGFFRGACWGARGGGWCGGLLGAAACPGACRVVLCRAGCGSCLPILRPTQSGAATWSRPTGRAAALASSSCSWRSGCAQPSAGRLAPLLPAHLLAPCLLPLPTPAPCLQFLLSQGHFSNPKEKDVWRVDHKDDAVRWVQRGVQHGMPCLLAAACSGSARTC